MIIDLTDYELKMYVYKKDGGYVAYADIPNTIRNELKEIDNEYFKFYSVHLIEFEKKVID